MTHREHSQRRATPATLVLLCCPACYRRRASPVFAAQLELGPLGPYAGTWTCTCKAAGRISRWSSGFVAVSFAQLDAYERRRALRIVRFSGLSAELDASRREQESPSRKRGQC